MEAQPPAPPPPPSDQPPPPPPPASSSASDLPVVDYPVLLDIKRQEEYSRLYPLVKWLAVIPNLVVFVFIAIAGLFVYIAGFFAVLITGRFPRGMFDFLVGVQRWAACINAYLFLMTDHYPPFSTQANPEGPVQFNIDYPEQGVSRWRPLFAWLVALPYLIVAGALSYLAAIVSFIAFFAILFTKKFPEGMYNLVLISLRWQARGNAYAGFMVTKYPPFVWG